MKRAIGIVSLALIFSASGMTQEKAPQDSPTLVSKAQNIKVPEGIASAKMQRGAITADGLWQDGRTTSGHAEKVAFYGSVAALWFSTALDIQSGNSLDPARFGEVNRFGGTRGQIATSAFATGAAYMIHRYGRGRARWISSALLAGASAAHYYGAIHNYSLK